MKTIAELSEKVEPYTHDALLAAFDGCHKIYLAMDEEEAKWFRENYEITFVGTPDELLATVMDWYEGSCFLRFVSAVSHNPDNPNAGFVSLIEQFEDEDDEDDEDEEDTDEDEEDN